MSAKQFEKSEEWTDDNFSDSGEFQDDHVSCFLQDVIPTLPLIFFSRHIISYLHFSVFSIFSVLLFYFSILSSFFNFNFVSSVLPSSFLHNILPPPCSLLIFSFLLKCSPLSNCSILFYSSLFFSFLCFSSLSLYLSALLAVSLSFPPPFINLRLIFLSFSFFFSFPFVLSTISH